MEKERQPLHKTYEAILKSLYCKIEDGVVCSIDDKPYTIDGKNIVIPSPDLLRENEWDDKIAFHPLCENALGGQSDIIRWLIKRVNHAITMNYCYLVTACIVIAQTTELQASIKNAKYTEYIGLLDGAKESTQKFWAKMIKTYADESSDVSFSNVYIQRATDIGDKTFARVAILDIPMLLGENAPGVLQGVKAPNRADRDMILEFTKKVFFGLEYQYGSNSDVPYFESLMKLYYAVASRLNEVRKILKGGIDDGGLISTVSLSWHKWLETDMLDQIGSIPPLNGNVGPAVTKVVETPKLNSKDPEAALLSSRTDTRGSRKSDDTPPWREDPKPSEPAPVRTPSKGISILGGDRNEGRDRDRDRDYDRRDRDRDYDRRDRGSRGRVNMFDRDYDRRDRDYEYNRRAHDRDYDRRDRDRDYDRRDRDRDRDDDRDYDRGGRGRSIKIL